MNQLSIIALITSVAIGLKHAFLLLPTPSIKPEEKTPVWQIIWEKVINFFNLDEAPVWRKILLRIALSALIVTALGCGTCDTYLALNSEYSFFWRSIVAVLLTIISSVLVILFCIGAALPKETLSENYFNIVGWDCTKRGQIKCIILNCSILCLWIGVFAIYVNTCGFRFYSISLSALITVGLCILLIFCGIVCYLLFLLFWAIVINPILHYFKWLVK